MLHKYNIPDAIQETELAERLADAINAILPKLIEREVLKKHETNNQQATDDLLLK